MQFYKVTVENTDDKPQYVSTMKDVKGCINAVPATMRYCIYIDLIEIAIDKTTLTHILSGWGASEKVLKSFKVTPRGGVVETNETGAETPS